ncbi:MULTISPECIES: hypothetical protein [unclassified Duganella]|uniref:hypothetical protein n=1 Tax=unclassified Duganella TaxID=2636909 RepID=UPI0006F86430|nr:MULTISPECIES: hypothetical protein [unclassified Duganella]KQV42956.1 hypothetical protein ASD07_21150 [Duganella sp. Root336D2]KRB97082.1 hypothetical protein ASE26_03335 [Duganella sp. Root198D2]
MSALRRRHGWLLPIAGLHLALLVCWRLTATPTIATEAQREGEMVFLMHIADRQPQPEAPRVPSAPRSRRSAAPLPTAAGPAVPAAASMPPRAELPPEAAAPDPFAQPAPEVRSLVERARSAAIGVDRELRKESKNDNDRALAHEPKLAQDIALAYKGSGAFSMTETVLPNGDSLARVTTPLGSYCILKRGNRDKAGLNAVDNNGKTFIVRCPK